MKTRIKKILRLKERELLLINELQFKETKKGKLRDLDKNEIEVKAQINILTHLLTFNKI